MDISGRDDVNPGPQELISTWWSVRKCISGLNRMLQRFQIDMAVTAKVGEGFEGEVFLFFRVVIL